MGTVGAKKSTPIGAKFLDHFLRCDRPLRNHLLSYCLRSSLAICAHDLRCVRLNQIDCGIRFKVLCNTLRYKYQRAHYANRQQNPQQAARSVHPKVAELVRLPSCDSADNRNGEYDANRGGDEIVISEAGHLGEIAHRAFTAVSLPVRVGCE